MRCFSRLVLVASVVGAVVAPQVTHADMGDDSRDLTFDAADLGAGLTVAGDFGATLATGDWNADGFTDLAIGSPFDTVGGDADAGSLAVVWGSATGPDLAGAEQIVEDDAWIDGATSEPSDLFASALTVGDFNGDAVDDLAVGAPGNGGATGAVYVFLGADGGFDQTAEQILQQGITLTDSSTVPETGEANDGFGTALAVGDFDDDGLDDLVIGVPGEDLGAPGVTDTGVAIVLFGSADETNPGVTADGARALGVGTGLEAQPLTAAGQAFGQSLLGVARSGGDLLVVGSVDVDRGVVIIPELAPDSDPVAEYSQRRFAASDLPGDAVDPALIGEFLAAGDFDADGEPDLIVGDVAQFFVIPGPIDVVAGLTDTAVFSAATEGFLPGGASPDPALFGRAAVGDLDNDGDDDLVVTFQHEAAWASTVLDGSDLGLVASGLALPGGTGGVVVASFDGDVALDAAFGDLGGDPAVLIRFGHLEPGEIRVATVLDQFESDGIVRHELVRENGSDGIVSIAVTIAGGPVPSATAAVDFPAVTKVVTWAAGEAGSKFADFEFFRDGTWEDVESVTIAHGDPQGGINTPGPVTVRMADVEIEAIEPVRLLDTRAGKTTIDMLYAGKGANPAGAVMRIPIAGRGGVPIGVTAVSLNVTVVRPEGPGYVTLFPCTAKPPLTSALNYSPGVITGNGSVATLNTAGELCIFTLATTHLVIDVNGYVPDGAAIGPIAPARLLDTRPTESTIDGKDVGGGPIVEGTIRKLQVAGRGGVPVDATSAMLNVTAANPAERGHITVYPCTATVPTTSSLNYAAGVTTGNGVVAKLSADGSVCLFAKSTTDVVVDVTGAGRATKQFETLAPQRMFDSRPPFDPNSTIGRLPPLQPQKIDAAKYATLDPGDRLRAVFVNITVVNPLFDGYVTLSSCGDTVPLASAINFRDGQTKGNNAVVLVSPDGTICATASVPTDVVIDIFGQTRLAAP